jgi:cyclohexanecarboxylate-CoA ligase
MQPALPPEASLWRARGFWPDRLITDDLDRHAAIRPDQLAYIDPNRSISYSEAVVESDRIARALIALGVERLDSVALQLPNCIEFALLHLALVRIGAITTLITPMSRSREIQGMLRNARARWFIVADQIRGFDHAAMAAQMAADPALGTRFRTIVLGEPHPGQIGWAEFLALGDWTEAAQDRLRARRPQPDEVAEIVFTSGTTSEAKGVMHTHNTLLAPQVAMAESLGIGPGSIVHMASTVAHQTGFLNGIRLPIQVGGCCVLQERWSGEAFAQLIAKHRIEVSSGSATFLLDLLRTPGIEQYDLSSLRVFRCGGGPIPIALVREAESRLPGLRVLRGWGQTENGVVTLSRLDDPIELRAEYDGHVQPGMSIRIVDESGVCMADGCDGRLQVRGAFQSPGYVNSPELMQESMVDSWFDTGDLALRHESGCIRISGRAKDIIIRGGENIPVSYVENVLFEDPRILEVAVVGMPDARLGERACAFVIPRGNVVLTLDAMKAFLRDKGVAAPYWPERLEVVESLPRTANGKVRKADLRERLKRSTSFESA